MVVTQEAALEEAALLKYKQRIIERLLEAIEPDVEAGEPLFCQSLSAFAR